MSLITLLGTSALFFLNTAQNTINSYSRFLPSLARDTLDKVLDRFGIQKEAVLDNPDIKCTVENNMLTIGETSAALYNPETRGKVPETLFYDTPQVYNIQ